MLLTAEGSEPLELTDEVSLDEVVALQVDALEALPSHRAQRRRSVWLTAVPSAVLVAWLVDGEVWERLVAGAVVLAALLYFYPRYFRSHVRRQTGKHLVDSLKGSGPYPLRYVLDDEGIQVDQHGHSLRFDWRDLLVVEERADDVVLQFPNGGRVRVANRAFVDRRQRDEAVAGIRQRLVTG